MSNENEHELSTELADKMTALGVEYASKLSVLLKEGYKELGLDHLSDEHDQHSYYLLTFGMHNLLNGIVEQPNLFMNTGLFQKSMMEVYSGFKGEVQ
jgi:hypothetical protein